MNYYNINSDVFFQQTYDVDMQSLYQPFLRYLPEKSLILDLGCGSGRDTLAFMQQGYQVEAIDSSVQLEPYRVCRRVNILRDYSDEKTKLYPRN